LGQRSGAGDRSMEKIAADLTEEGEALLAAYDRYEQELKEEGRRLFEKHFAPFMDLGPGEL
ncbi:MAG: hypothetical protein K2O45_04340, partial [Oscillospiraceae bacterium]|nr:hypothetical protein [Oscillospiraceae bacterium]